MKTLINETNEQQKLQTQEEAIKYFIQKMDIEMIDAFLDKNKTYQEMEKYLFISKLQKVFETFEGFGDTFLIPINGSCGDCDKTKSGFTFYGNKSKNYITIIFDLAGKTIHDLYECATFINTINEVDLKEQIFIDEDDVEMF